MKHTDGYYELQEKVVKEQAVLIKKQEELIKAQEEMIKLLKMVRT